VEGRVLEAHFIRHSLLRASTSQLRNQL
jgi:hypothetical protein